MPKSLVTLCLAPSMYITAWNSPHVQSKLVWWMSGITQKELLLPCSKILTARHHSTQSQKFNSVFKRPPWKGQLSAFILFTSVCEQKTSLSPNWLCCNPHLGTSSGTAEMFFCLDYKAQDQNAPLFSELGIKIKNACIPKCCTERSWIMWRLKNMRNFVSETFSYPLSHVSHTRYAVYLTAGFSLIRWIHRVLPT